MDAADQPTTSSEPPPITVAVAATKSTIEARARGHRNLVVAVVVIMLTSLTLAFFFWPWMPLLGGISLIPLCAFFLWLDLRRVRCWQARVLELCLDDGLAFDVLTRVLSSDKRIPPTTLSAMLLSIRPLVQMNHTDLVAENPKSKSAKQQLGSLSRRNEIRTLIGGGVSTIVAATAVWLWIHPTWTAGLATLSSLVLAIGCRKWL